jgi:uncharacterized damage-inducible protein DinB
MGPKESPSSSSRKREPTDEELRFPVGTSDERELLLRWLGFLRSAVLRNIEGLSDEQSRWRPEGALLPLIGIVNHLTNVESRWIDYRMVGREVSRREQEFNPGTDLSLAAVVRAYRDRADVTDAAVRSMALDQACNYDEGTDLRWVLLHLINETARHAGHADATRELLDGTTGE